MRLWFGTRFTVALIVAFLVFVPVMQQALGQTSTKPEIVDLTTGTPVTGSNFTIKVTVTSDTQPNGITLVRLYLWHEIPSGITDTQIIEMERHPNLMMYEYRSTVDVPQNASTMNYYITAYDNLGTANNTDAISRPVRDIFYPVAVCALTVQANMGEPVTFDGTGSTDNVGVANYTWSFNVFPELVRFYGPNPTREYPEPGVYETWLIVTDAWDNVDSQSFNVTILDPVSPIADAGFNLTVYSGNLLFLDGSGSADNHRIANYTWTFMHNGSQVSIFGESPEYIFWEGGVHTITLTVTDASGNTATDTVPVTVLGSLDDDSGMDWWIYVLIIIVIMIIVAGIIIAKT